MSRILVVVENNLVKIITDSPDVEVLVADRDVDLSGGLLSLDGAPVGLETFLEGLPTVDAPRVTAAFEALAEQLPTLTAQPITQKYQTQLANYLRRQSPPGLPVA